MVYYLHCTMTLTKCAVTIIQPEFFNTNAFLQVYCMKMESVSGSCNIINVLLNYFIHADNLQLTLSLLLLFITYYQTVVFLSATHTHLISYLTNYMKIL